MAATPPPHPHSVGLLNFPFHSYGKACSFLDPDAIPLSLAAEAQPAEPAGGTAGDPLAVADALAVLGRYSLVRGTSSDTVGLHRLVQLVIRDRLGAEGRSRWAAAVVTALAAVFPADSGDITSWGSCSLLLPHAMAATGHAETAAVEPKATSWLLDRAAAYLQGRAQFIEAKMGCQAGLAPPRSVDLAPPRMRRSGLQCQDGPPAFS